MENEQKQLEYEATEVLELLEDMVEYVCFFVSLFIIFGRKMCGRAQVFFRKNVDPLINLFVLVRILKQIFTFRFTPLHICHG